MKKLNVRPIASESPRINLLDFTKPDKKKRNFGPKTSGSGYFDFVSLQGPTIKTYFQFKIGPFFGYLRLRYAWDSEYTEQIIKIACIRVNNYSHKLWSFECYNCLRTHKNLFMVDGPHWICGDCVKWKGGMNNGGHIINPGKLSKPSVGEIKKGLSARSIGAKKRALEKFILLQEQLRKQSRP